MISTSLFRKISTISHFIKQANGSKKNKLIFIVLGSIVTGILELCGIVVLYLLVKYMIQVNSSSQPSLNLLSSFFQFIEITSSQNRIIFLNMLLLFVFIFKNIYIYFFQRYKAQFIRDVKHATSLTLINGYCNLEYSKLVRYNSSQILRNIVSNVNLSLNGYLLPFVQLLSSITVILIVMLLVMLKNPFFTIGIIASLLLPVTILFKSTKKHLLAQGEERNVLLESINKSITNLIHSYKDTTILGVKDFFIDKFNNESRDLAQNEYKTLIISFITPRVLESVVILIVVLFSLYLFIVNQSSNDEIFASLAALGAIGFRLSPLFYKSLYFVQQMQKNEAAFHEIFYEFSNFNNTDIKRTGTSKKNFILKNSISINNVSFKYKSSQNDIFTKINLKVSKGEFIGIIGASGKGKSTLFDLLMGFLPPSEGSITIDGEKLNHENLESWREKISLVSQHTFIDSTNLTQNIAFGLKQESINNKRVNQIIKQVGLDSISSEASLGESGNLISGGQKQRVGIARALYHQTEVLFLDEITSSLDPLHEKKILNLIEKFKGEKTIFFITHKTQNLKRVDRIIFIHNENEILIDTYQNLLSNKIFLDFIKSL